MPRPSTKPRGHPRDSPQVIISKTLSWILRHGAESEGLPMRQDGYLRVADLLTNHRLQFLHVDLGLLQETVKNDAKNRYDLICEAGASVADTEDPSQWWIRANQGHSIRSVQVELQPVLSAKDVLMAVHGTNLRAWEAISKEGLSKMRRNHIHMAQGVPGDNVISGMRTSSAILIYIDLDKAISAGIKFFVSSNGAVLTEGDDRGFLSVQFFRRVENAKREPLPGWEGTSMSVVETSTEPEED